MPLPPGEEPLISAQLPSTRSIFANAIWIGLGFGYGQVLRMVANIILARILYPEAFGLLAMAYTVMVGLMLFSDVGIRTSIVQNPRGDDPHFLNTAWTLQIIRGWVLGLGACMLAWPTAYIRAVPEPRLLWILPLISCSSIIDGFISTKIYSLHRHMAQRSSILIEVAAQTSGIGLTVFWAWHYHHIVALALGPITQSLVKMILSHVLLQGVRNRLAWDRQAVHAIFHLGKWIFLSTLLFFLAGNIDKLVVGYYSLTWLGMYNIASQFAMVTVLLMQTVALQLLFPLYSKWSHSQKDHTADVHRMHTLVAGAAALLIAGSIAAGPTFIRTVYDNRYQEAGWILSLLAISAWFTILESNAAQYFMALGRAHYGAIGNGIKVVVLVILIPIGRYFDSIRGLIYALIIGDFARYVFTTTMLRSRKINLMPYDIAWTIFVGAAGIGFGQLGEYLLPEPNSPTKNLPILLQRLAFDTVVVILFWSLAMSICERVTRKQPAPEIATEESQKLL